VTTTPAGSITIPQVPVLEATGITVRFGGLVALNDVNLVVPHDMIVGLVGPNGAGKSTLFSVLSGLLTPNGGSVRLGGKDVTRWSAHARARLGMSRTFQHSELFSSLTVREHIMLAYRVKHARARLWSDMFTGRGFRRGDQIETDRVDAVIGLLRLGPVANRAVLGLPFGTSRLIEVARAVAAEPRLLLLDEPGSGLDVSEREQLADVLATLVAGGGLSLLLVEHDIDMVLRISQLVHVLDFGVCIASGPPEEVRANQAVQTAYLGDLTTKAPGP
jgi:branched-chain amino acid transport system ATP-binding protein